MLVNFMLKEELRIKTFQSRSTSVIQKKYIWAICYLPYNIEKRYCKMLIL